MPRRARLARATGTASSRRCRSSGAGSPPLPDDLIDHLGRDVDAAEWRKLTRPGPAAGLHLEVAAPPRLRPRIAGDDASRHLPRLGDDHFHALVGKREKLLESIVHLACVNRDLTRFPLHASSIPTRAVNYGVIRLTE